MWTGGIYKYNWLLLGGTEYDPASDDRKKSTWLKKKTKTTTNKQKTFNINLLWAKNNKKKLCKTIVKLYLATVQVWKWETWKVSICLSW